MSEAKEGDFYRNKDTGDLYQIKEMDGVLKIVRDLPNQQIWMPMSQLHRFNKESHAKRLLPGQLARVAFESDAALCSCSVDLPRPKKWLDLSGQEKAKWIEGKAHLPEPIRKQMYIAVMRVLLDYNKDE